MKTNSLLIAAFLSIMLACITGTADEIEAEIGVDAVAPEISNISLRDWENTQDVTVIDPEVQYLLNFSVSDNNSLANLDTIVVRMYESTQEAHEADGRQSYSFTYDESEDEWTSIPSGRIHPSTTVPENKSGSNFTFFLYFSLDGIAVPTGEATFWVIEILATDDEAETSNRDDSTTFDVNEYRAFESYTGAFSWSSKKPGDVLETKAIDPSIRSNMQVSLWTTGADLEYEGYSIPVSYINVHNSTDSQSLSTSPLALYSNFTETQDSINEGISGYIDGVQKTMSFDGILPNPLPSGSYVATWTITLEDMGSPA